MAIDTREQCANIHEHFCLLCVCEMLSSHVYYFWRSSLILLDSFVERPLGSLFQKEVFAINSINLFVLSSHVILSKCYYCSLKTINVLVHWLSLSFINELQTTVSTLYLSLTAFIHNTWYLIFEFIWHKTVSLVSLILLDFFY